MKILQGQLPQGNKMEENKDADRKCVNHLANERTFLAWIRTSIGLMAFGFVVERFGLFADFFLKKQKTSATALPGLILILIGAIMAVTAFISYRNNLNAIEENRYRSAKQFPLFLTLLVLIMGIFLSYYLVN